MPIARLARSLLMLLVIVAAAAMTVCSQNVADLYTVTSTGDSHDAIPGDHLCADATNTCTLRAAIEEANADPTTRDVITFAYPGPETISLTLGELTIAGNVSIVGTGARILHVEPSVFLPMPQFRVFHVIDGLSSVSIRDLSIYNGSPVDTDGAGILIDRGSSVTLTDLQIEGNGWPPPATKGSGGGVFNSGNLTISRCLFVGNGAITDGAALATDSNSTVTVSNSTFAENGGYLDKPESIYNSAGATLLLVNDTFYRNSEFSNNASAVANFGTASVLNTLFPDPAGLGFSLSGTFVSLGNNIVVDPDHSTGFVNGVNGDQVGNISDPHVAGDIADNGGLTNTLALLPGSPAIDHGNLCVRIGNCAGFSGVLQTDQRGFLRSLVDTPDVGAYETSAIQPARNASYTFGAGTLGGGGPAMLIGSIGVLTDPVTNQKYYTRATITGRYYFQNVPARVVVFEIKSKRQQVVSGPLVISLDDLVFINNGTASQSISLAPGLTLTTASPLKK